MELLYKELAKDEENDYAICITGDHSTPVSHGDHTFEPVPISLAGLSNILKVQKGETSTLSDGVESYDEISCASSEGALGRFSAYNIIPLLKSYAQKLIKH